MRSVVIFGWDMSIVFKLRLRLRLGNRISVEYGWKGMEFGVGILSLYIFEI
jgi:hypothetical protein